MGSRNDSGSNRAPGAVLCECSFSDLLERPEIPIPTAPEGKLLLANPVGKLDAG